MSLPLQSIDNNALRSPVSNPRPNNTVAIDSHALGTLNYIRASIEAAGAFAVPGIAGIAMGVVGVVATIVASIPGLTAHWVETWLISAMAASAIGVFPSPPPPPLPPRG